MLFCCDLGLALVNSSSSRSHRRSRRYHRRRVVSVKLVLVVQRRCNLVVVGGGGGVAVPRLLMDGEPHATLTPSTAATETNKRAREKD